MIAFEIVQSKEAETISKLCTYPNAQKVRILQDGKEVGHIFAPASSGVDNGIQICGFTEAFDIWGCGIYKGFKDIQLLFDDKQMKGTHNSNIGKGCLRCFRDPCQCENKIPKKATHDMVEGFTDKYNKKYPLPFNIKNTMNGDLKKRIVKVKK